MLYKIRYLVVITLLFINYVNAKAFYEYEPILNTKVYVQTFGDKNKPPVVLVHGLGDEASDIWKESIELLKKDYYILTFDLPGFGKSSKENREYTPKNYSLFINYLVSKYIEKPFYLIGHSMGGAISLKYTSMFQKDIKSLMLIDVAGILNKDSYSSFLVNTGVSRLLNRIPILEQPITDIFSSIKDTLQNIMPKNLTIVLESELMRQMFLNSSPNAIAAVGLVNEDFSKVLSKINTSTYILWGEEDDIAPVRIGYMLNKLLKNSKLHIIETSKHTPMLDAKKEYEKALKNFLLNKKIRQEIDKKITFKNLRINNQSNTTIEGDIDYLSINNSNNIIIKNSNIKKLEISNSNVKIINSTIASNSDTLKITQSNVFLTASHIKGYNAIITNNSKLDFAGCEIQANQFAVKNQDKTKNSKLVFSITKVDSLLNKNKTFHKTIDFKYNKNI